MNTTDNLQTKKLVCVYQELGSERPSDLYDRFQGDLLRYKAAFSRLSSSPRSISPSPSDYDLTF